MDRADAVFRQKTGPCPADDPAFPDGLTTDTSFQANAPRQPVPMALKKASFAAKGRRSSRPCALRLAIGDLGGREMLVRKPRTWRPPGRPWRSR